MPTLSPLVLELREFLEEGRAKLWRRTSWRAPIAPWLAEHSQLLDAVLTRIYNAAIEHAREVAGEHAPPDGEEPGLLLVAIGGYGRTELCPFSDIDIAFVPEEEEDPFLDAAVKEAFRLIVEVLLDGAKLEVGYAYRPIGDVERLDHQSKAALLEARRIAGAERLMPPLRAEVHRTWDAVEFALEKAAERRERINNIALSQYAVEPNLKEGTGALRDIHFSLWSAAALLKTEQPLEELVRRGVITRDGAAQVEKARDFFLRLRVWLHLQSGKHTDVLRLEYQDRAARSFSYTGARGMAAQRLLAHYYVHAENAARFCDRVLSRLLEGPLPFDGHFVATRGSLAAPHPFTLRNNPELVLTPFRLARKYGFTISPDLLRDIDEALELVTDATRKNGTFQKNFLKLIGELGNASAVLSELRALGVLQTVIPETTAMFHLAPPDPSHELTVGEHSIQAVRKLDEMWRERRADDEMFAVWNGVEDHALLVLATLLHDVGKIEPNTDHSVSGEKLGAKIAERLGLSSPRVDTLKLLIRRHLILPRIARLHDLSAPATIRRVISLVRDVPTLKMLYLLSIADTKAVGERSYSTLDLKAMRELYERCLIAMTRAETAQVLSDEEKREQLVQEERERMRRQMRHLELDETTLKRLTDTLPAAYVLNTPLPTMATHLKFLDQLPEEQLIVDFYHEGRSFAEMTVVAYDDPQPGLLAKICGVVHAADAEIVAAHVYTLRGDDLNSKWMFSAPEYGRDVILDRLNIIPSGRTLTSSQTARIAKIMRDVLCEGQSVEEVLKAAGKKSVARIVPIKIEARNDLSDEHTVISLVCNNMSGLLYHISRAVAALGLDTHTAKVTTWGGQAEDAFYVTKRGADGRGAKIPDGEISAVLDALKKELWKPGTTGKEREKDDAKEADTNAEVVAP